MMEIGYPVDEFSGDQGEPDAGLGREAGEQ